MHPLSSNRREFSKEKLEVEGGKSWIVFICSVRFLILKWMLPKISLFHFLKEDLDSFMFWERKKVGVPMNYLDQADLTIAKLKGSRVHIDSNWKGLGVF